MSMEELQLKREQAETEIKKWTKEVIREILFLDERENLKFQFIQIGVVKSIAGIYKVKDSVLIDVIKEFFQYLNVQR